MSKPQEILAIIPARGGSKGLPRKNVIPLAGRPLIAHNIAAALASEYVTRTIVSTDDPEISNVSLQFGAEVIDRPAEIAGDKATSESALIHAIEHLAETEGYAPDLIVFLQCTSPLTMAEDIDGTIDALLREKADTALAVAPFHYFVWKREGRDVVGVNHDKAIRPRRQDRDPQFLETGAVYVMKRTGFMKAKHRFFGRTAMHEMPPDRVLEVDDPIDFVRAEAAMRDRQDQDRAALLPSPVEALVMDFDGVFTDNRVWVIESGQESVVCSRGDGMGLDMVRRTGLPLLVISKEQNPVVQARCNKLRLPCMQRIDNKLPSMLEWLSKQNARPENTIYIGNDVNDLECMRAVGCPAAPADAHPEALRAARLVLKQNGGHGALRELCDMILAERTKIE